MAKQVEQQSGTAPKAEAKSAAGAAPAGKGSRAAARYGGTQASTPAGEQTAGDVSPVAAAFSSATAGPPEDLPHRGDMQSLFNDAFDVQAYTGKGAELSDMGARAAASDNKVAFADAAPSKSLVAHELTHVVQQRAGGVSTQAKSATGSRGGAAEAEADAVEARVAHYGVGGQPVQVRERPDAGIHLAPPSAAPAADPGGAPGAVAGGVGSFVSAPSRPPGRELATVTVAVARAPKALVAALSPAASGTITLALIGSGSRLTMYAKLGSIAVAATVDGAAVTKELLAIVGDAAAAADKLPTMSKLIAGARSRFIDLGNGRVKVQLFRAGGTDSFVVFDLLRIGRGLTGGSTSGFRPVEANIQLGAAGGATLYGDGAIKEQTVLPPDDQLVGSSFEIPDAGSIRKKLFGLDEPGPVTAAVYYGDGVLSVGLKTSPTETTGFVANVGVEYLLGKLKKLGQNAAQLLDSFLAKLKDAGRKLLSVVGGLLKFDFDGGFIDFDLKLQLPRLTGGGGFSLSSLFPSNFKFELPNFSMVSLPSFDWLTMPGLPFKLPSDMVGRLLRLMPNLPSWDGLTLPSLPSSLKMIDFSSLKLGLSFDLSVLADLIPSFGGGRQFGMTLNLRPILEKIGALGSKFADWLAGLAARGMAFVNRYLHLGGDFVLRVYDGNDPGNMVGFNLVQLLDGVSADALVPVETRLEGGEFGEITYGVAKPSDAPADAAAPADKVDAKRPQGDPIAKGTAPMTKSVRAALGADKDAPLAVELFVDDARTQAYGTVKGSDRGMLVRLEHAKLGRALGDKVPLPKIPGADKLPAIRPNVAESKQKGGLVVSFGPQGDAAKDSKAMRGYAMWRPARFFTGELSPATFVPDELRLDAPGAFGFAAGPISVPGDALGSFSFASKATRANVLRVEDDKETVHATVYYEEGGGQLSLALRPDAASKTGVSATVSIDYLLDRLEALGDVGQKILSAIGRGAGKAADAGGKALGAIKRKMLGLSAGGLLDINLGGGNSIGFNLGLQLPKLAASGFDLSGLVPSSFSFGLGDGLRISSLPGKALGWVRMPKLGGFSVGAGHVKAFLDSLSIPAPPKLSGLPFNVHIISARSLRIGLAVDLSSLMPGVGGGHFFGAELDLTALLGHLQGAGVALRKKVERYAKQGAGAFKRWVHLDESGILRLFDGRNPDGSNQIAFDLKNFLGGLNVSALTPVELRLVAERFGTIEIGEPGAAAAGPGDEDGDAKADKAPAGKVMPKRPAGDALFTVGGKVPSSIAGYLTVGKDATLKTSAYWAPDAGAVHAYAEASDKTGEKQALLVTANYRKMAAALGSRIKLPALKTPKKLQGLDFDPELSKQKAGIAVRFGSPDADAQKGAPSGYAVWKIHKLLRPDGFTPDNLIPDEFSFAAEGKAAVAIGAFTPPGDALDTFEFESAKVRSNVLRADPVDGKNPVFASAYFSKGTIAVALTPVSGENNGVFASVELEYLLSMLAKLGKAGEALLDKLVEKAGGKSAGGSLLDKAKAAAKSLGDKIVSIASGLLKIDLGDLGFIGFNLRAQLPKLAVGGLNLRALIPDSFDIKLPDIGGLSLLSLPKIDWKGMSPLGAAGGFPVPSANLKKLASMLPSLDLPKKLPSLRFFLDMVDPGSLTLGLSIDLSALTGTPQFFGVKVSLQALLSKAKGLADWLSKKLGFDLGGKAPAKGKNPMDYLHMGGDGVLRIYADPAGNQVAFDLKKLLDGFDPNDVVPVEMRLEADKFGSIEYGSSKPDKTPEAGQVLATRPKGQAVITQNVPAPALLREHFSIPAKSKVKIQLILDSAGGNAAMYAEEPKTKQALVVNIDYQEVANAIGSKVSLPAAMKDPKLGGVSLSKQLSIKNGGLAVTFGPSKGDKSPGKPRGYAVWRLGRFFASSSISLSTLVPDVFHVETDKGGLSFGMGLSTAGYQGPIKVPLPPSIGSLVGGAKEGGIYTKGAKGGDLQFLLAALDDKSEDGLVRGVELSLDDAYVREIKERITELGGKTKTAVKKAFSRTKGAGNNKKKKKSKKSKVGFSFQGSGIQISYGAASDPNYMHAIFSYAQLLKIASGEGDVASMMPVGFKISTKVAGIEVGEYEGAKAGGQEPPAGAKKVSSMPGIISGALGAIGIGEQDMLELDLEASKIVDATAEPAEVLAVGHIFSKDEETETWQGKTVKLTLNLDAVLAQVVPAAKKLSSKKKKKPKKKKKSSFKVGLGIDEDTKNVELSLEASKTNRKGNTRSIKVQAGWTIGHIIKMIANMGDIAEHPELLAPDTLEGEFKTDLLSVGFQTDAGSGDHELAATTLPGFGRVLRQFFSPETVSNAKIHVSYPSTKEFADSVMDIRANGGYVDLVGIGLEIPGAGGEGKSKIYGLNLGLSWKVLLRLSYMIPELGIFIKLAVKAVEAIEDPIGALEGVAYSPEMIYQFIKHGPDIITSIPWEDMSATDIAMMFAMSDASTKQAVMAGRALSKLKKNGYEMKKMTVEELREAMGVDAETAEKMMNFILAQSDEDLKAMLDHAKWLERKGIKLPTPDPSEIDFDNASLDAAQFENQRVAIEAGYLDMQKAVDAADPDADMSEAQQKAAKKFMETLAKYGKAGAKASPIKDARGEEYEEEDEEDVEIPEVADPGDSLQNIEGIPTVTEDQWKEASKLFQKDKKGPTMVFQRDYLVMKYAHLPTDKLADILQGKPVQVKMGEGTFDITPPLPKDEHDFVLHLFLLRIDPEGELVKPGATKGPDWDQDKIDKRIKKWRSGEETAKAGEKPKKDDEKKPDDKKKPGGGTGDKKKPGGKKKPGDGTGDKKPGDGDKDGDGEGGESDSEEDLWGEDGDWENEPDDTDGDGDGDGDGGEGDMEGPQPDGPDVEPGDKEPDGDGGGGGGSTEPGTEEPSGKLFQFGRLATQFNPFEVDGDKVVLTKDAQAAFKGWIDMGKKEYMSHFGGPAFRFVEQPQVESRKITDDALAADDPDVAYSVTITFNVRAAKAPDKKPEPKYETKVSESSTVIFYPNQQRKDSKTKGAVVVPKSVNTSHRLHGKDVVKPSGKKLDLVTAGLVMKLADELEVKILSISSLGSEESIGITVYKSKFELEPTKIGGETKKSVDGGKGPSMLLQDSTGTARVFRFGQNTEFHVYWPFDMSPAEVKEALDRAEAEAKKKP